MPALADSFITRPETAPGLISAVAPGTMAALVPAPSPVPDSAHWLGASGKTQLAVGCAESLWQSGAIDVLVWVAATSRAAVLSGYVEAATATMGAQDADDAEIIAGRFVTWLHDTARPWLVVLDGLDDPADLDGLWPEGQAGRVLITASRSAALGDHESKSLILPVGRFSPREALSYVMGRLTADPDQRLGAIDLIKDLGCEPLALAQASGVIASSALSCRDYRDYFLRRRDQLAPPDSDLPAGAVTWTFCVEQADRLSSDGSAQAVLTLAALLDGHAIPGAVFTATAARAYVAGDGEAPADRERIRGALLMAQRAGLLAIDLADTQATVRMNPVVQTAIRGAMPPEMLERACRAAADSLEEVWPAEEPWVWLAEELRSCTVALQRHTGDLLWAGGAHPVLALAGRSLAGARLSGPAVAYWRGVATVSDRTLGSEHPDTLLAGEQLARAYLAAGRPAEAVPWFQWALARRTHADGPDRPATIAARQALGQALVAAGQLAEATTVLEAATADYERVRGADHPDTLGARDELASAYRSSGRYDDAIALFRRILSDREHAQGGQHPDTTATRGSLADAYLAAGRNKDAINQYKKVLSDVEREHGRDHADTITARDQLGSAYEANGKMGAALKEFEQARAGCVQVRGPDHPETLERSARLAQAYYSSGRLADAVTLLRDTLTRCEQSLPDSHPLTTSVRESLGKVSDF